MSQVIPGSVHEAQAGWLDVERWPQWMDGAARVVSVDGAWPQVGSRVIWESGPAGRGRVTETVTEFEPLTRLTTAVEDDAMKGRQEVSFEPVADGVQVELTIDYRMKRRSPVAPLIEALFVRRPMILSLTRTLGQFHAHVG